jgi:hypothetical protein
VATDRAQWDLKAVYEGLFDYCFPTHFKLELREKLRRTSQGSWTVRDYAREVENLAIRFPDVSEREVLQIFWEGIRPDLRCYLREKGLSPEKHSLEHLIKYAARREDAVEALKREEKAWKGQPAGRRWGRFENRVEGPQPAKGPTQEKGKGNQPAETQGNSGQNTVNKKEKEKKEQSTSKPPQRPKLSKEERDKLRAEQRCFSCKEVGHESRNCPKRWQAKAPNIKAGAVNIAEVDAKAAKAREVELNVGAMRTCEAEEECRWWTLDEIFPAAALEWAAAGDSEAEGVNVEGTPEEELEALWDSYGTNIADFEGPYRACGLENCYVAGWWLLEGFQLLGRRHGGWRYMSDFEVDLTQVEEGYLISLDPGWIDIHVPFETIIEEDFSIWELLDCAWLEYGRTVLERRERVQATVWLNSMARGKGSKRKSKTEEAKSETVERTSMHVHDFKRIVPKPIVITVKINGQPVRALVDCGSEADFVSTTVVDQLRLKRDILAKPLNIRLAVHGSRSKTNASTTVNFQYQEIDEQHRFDVANLDNYDVILGTPFLYQHQVVVGFNPTRVVIGSAEAREMRGEEVEVVSSAAADVVEEDLQKIRTMLKEEAQDLCPDTSTTALPPFRAINYTIPLVDEEKVCWTRGNRTRIRGSWRLHCRILTISCGTWRDIRISRYWMGRTHMSRSG